MKRNILFFLLVGIFCSGCVQGIPRDALELKAESLADRQLQTRRFETLDYESMLSAASAVFQDLGFTLEESEASLGIIVGSKHRDATSGAQIAGAMVVALLGGGVVPVDSDQTIRASMVMRAISSPDSKNVPQKKVGAEEFKEMKNNIEKTVWEKLRPRYSEDMSRRLAVQIAEKSIETLVTDIARLDKLAGSGESTVRVTFQRIIFNTAGHVTLAEQIVDPEIYQDFFDKLSHAVFLEAHEL